jgi:tRNA (adenine37-N6)-methyltransferase
MNAPANRSIDMGLSFAVHPIGLVRKFEDQVWIDIEPAYADGLLGLDGFSHITVLYWFDRNDNPQQRGILQVHPRRNPANPLTGVFATHAPVRPNLIALTTCRLLSIDHLRLNLETIDALDETPVIDIKGYIPCRRPPEDFRTPSWLTHDS